MAQMTPQQIKLHYTEVKKSFFRPNHFSLAKLFNLYEEIHKPKKMCFSCRSSRATVMKYFKNIIENE